MYTYFDVVLSSDLICFLLYCRDERPPTLSGPGAQTPVGTKRWIPPSSVKRDVPTPDDKNDVVFRKVRGYAPDLLSQPFTIGFCNEKTDGVFR